MRELWSWSEASLKMLEVIGRAPEKLNSSLRYDLISHRYAHERLDNVYY